MNSVFVLPDSLLALPNTGKWRKDKALLRDNLFALGAPKVDARLQGGLPRAALHEVLCEKSVDIASASAFALLLSLRLASAERPLIWVQEQKAVQLSGHLYPPGLIALGGNPDAMVLVDVRDAKEALRAAADIIRSGAPSAMIMSVRDSSVIDLTATRRLALAAADKDVLAVLLRLDAKSVPSAAYSRWQVTSAPSRPLLANAPGFPAFDIELTRHRGGTAPFATRVEWNYEERTFQDSPLSGSLFAAVVGGAAEAPERQIA